MSLSASTAAASAPQCEHKHPAYCEMSGPLNYFCERLDGSVTMHQADEEVRGNWFGQSSFATHAIASVHNPVKFPDDLSIELLGPLGCGLQTGAGSVLNVLQAKAGEGIAIFGLGGVGLGALLAAKAVECDPIIAVDLNPARLEIALELGATHTINPAETDDLLWRVQEIAAPCDPGLGGRRRDQARGRVRLEVRLGARSGSAIGWVRGLAEGRSRHARREFAEHTSRGGAVTGNLISGRSRGRGITRLAALLAACGIGAVAEYFLDRDAGRRRRHLARDRSLARLRHGSRATVRRGKYLEGVAEGLAYRTAHRLPVVGRKDQPDDVTLAQKVESIALREAHTPKGHVSINAERGVVYLRGQLDSAEQVEALVRAASAVEGVKGVKNLLHTAK